MRSCGKGGTAWCGGARVARGRAEHAGRVRSREQLLEKVWGYDYYGEIRVVDVHVGHIRRKLGDDRFIATVRGAGYRFEDLEG